MCPDAKPPAHVHAMAGVDDASIASDASRVIILAQQAECKPIDPNFFLLNSQSTVNLFSNPQLVENVCQAATPINIHCNKGSMPTKTVADFGGNEVYLNPDGIARVLSLFHLSQNITSPMTARIGAVFSKSILLMAYLNSSLTAEASTSLIFT